jgi:hypothetical protein
MVSYTEKEAVLKTSGDTLFRIRHRQVRVSGSTLKPRGESWDDERIERFVQDLDEIGVRIERKRPRAPLDSLADDDKRARFLALMEQVPETLTG